MGAGKSTVGKLLARKLDRRFIDADALIEERCGVKIPLLGDIPLIGHFFQHKSTLRDKTELLVFITPTVLGKP